MYLRYLLKDGTAKGVIEGLSQFGDCYSEAIKSLKAHYDIPQFIHQTRIRTIIEATALSDGTGKELRRLHDVVQQHLRALKAMEYEPSGPEVTPPLHELSPTVAFREGMHISASMQEMPEATSYLVTLGTQQ